MARITVQQTRGAMWQHRKQQDAVDDLTHRPGARPARCAGLRQVRRDHAPLSVGQIGLSDSYCLQTFAPIVLVLMGQWTSRSPGA